MPFFSSPKKTKSPSPSKPKVDRGFKEIPTDKIKPWRFANRPESEYGDLDGLSVSIGSHGQQFSAVVRPSADGFELIAGRRRYEVCRSLGLPLKCDVRKLTDQEAFTIQAVENEQREELSAYARALDYQRALDAGLFPSVASLASSIGQSRASVSNILSFTRLSPRVKEAMGDMSGIGVQKIKTVVRLINESPDNEEIIVKRSKDIVSGKLSTAGLEKLCRDKSTSLSQRKVVTGNLGDLFSVTHTPRGALSITILKDGKRALSEDQICEVLRSAMERV
jgi:ParB/RepB/Spo0J family partition protein